MLFKVIANKDIFELNPELNAIEEFSRCTDRQLKWVMLVYDYKTPYKGLRIEDRKLRVALDLGYKLEKGGKRPDKNTRSLIDGKVGTVVAAVNKFKEIQWNEDYETLKSYDMAMEDIRAFIVKPEKTTTELSQSIKFMKELATLQSLRKELRDILGLMDEGVSEEVDVETELSTLDLVNQEEMEDYEDS